LTAMEMAREAQIKISLDLNLRLELWGLDNTTRAVFDQAIELSDVVLGSAKEEFIPYTGRESIENASQIICGGKRIVAARSGKDGVRITTSEDSFSVPAFDTEVVDTVGAGDAFNSGFIAACLHGLDLLEAARWGNAVASLKVGQSGARALPDLQAVKQRLELV